VKDPESAVMAQDLINKSLQGKCVTKIDNYTQGMWQFYFDEWYFIVSAPWRLVNAEAFLIGRNDDGQWYGLTEPVNTTTRATDILHGRKVASVLITVPTADLRVLFEGDLEWQVLTDSIGYEPWNFSGKTSNINIVALGGGELSLWY